MSRPRLLDLFCGAGGAARGYQLAGFHVTGVDIEAQPNYAGDAFFQGDAFEIMRGLLDAPVFPFDAIHASPPCQAYSAVTPNQGDHPDLVAPTRELLEATGLPWVMENVPGAPMRHQIVLCGSMFGLGANGRQLRRHRLFESNVPMMSPPCQHSGEPVGVYGTGGGGQMTRGYKGTPAEYREAMGIDWATRAEIAQAIPPAFAEHIGGYLLAAVRARAAA